MSKSKIMDGGFGTDLIRSDLLSTSIFLILIGNSFSGPGKEK
jgi:hypothetical protein